MTAADIIQQQQQALYPRGYRVQDMGSKFGGAFAGQFRWVHLPTATFGEPAQSESAAWIAAGNDDLARSLQLQAQTIESAVLQ